MNEPWTSCPSLTEDRLQIIAAEIVQTRAEVALEYKPGRDTPWSFGCRAYDWTCQAITSLALSAKHPWLRIRKAGLSFRILVDGLPIRFYKGNAEKPNARTLRRSLEDVIAQQQFAFLADTDDKSAGEWFWLLAIETIEDGTVSRVVLIQANAEGQTKNPWEIPLAAHSALTSSIERQPVELPAPLVKSKKSNITEDDSVKTDADLGT